MLVGFVVTLRRLWRGHRRRTALRRFRETSAFQDNTFEGCNLAEPQIHAVGNGFCTTPFCDCSAVALANTICRITPGNFGQTKICRITDQPRCGVSRQMGGDVPSQK